ncbi:MAG TPA: Gfo/Idh/MocA family oxidoreductase [candidate division Zixibacteria bacterium]|nr:Gfo/Idh/MocA family oxidoreductase [candidate division Zixibacteria bacterium]
MRANGRTIPQRFLVLGCGSIGKRHIRNLRALGAREIVVFDVAPARRGEAAAAFGVKAVKKLEEAWEERPAACVVAVPTAFHVELALEAARRGIHLFIEKPLSHTARNVDRLLAEVRRRDIVTLVGCNLRFHPGLSQVKRLLAKEAVGRVAAARIEAGQYLPDWHPGEDYRRGYSARRALGGGVILDAIHEIDYARWLLGEVTAVTAMAAKLSRLEIDTEDVAALLLRFAGGALGEIHLDYIQRAYSRTCQIIGDEGTIRWDYTAGEVRWYSARSGRWRLFSNPPGWEPNRMYLDEMEHFLRCLERKEKPALDAFEAARVLEIALAAKIAARRGVRERSGTCSPGAF